MTYETQIQSLLYSSTAIKALLKTWVYDSITYYAIFNTSLLPDNVSTDSGLINLTVNDTTLNHYRVGNVEAGELIYFTTHIITCRAKKESTAIELQQKACDVLNLKHLEGSAFQVVILPVIAPSDDTDNYNAPLEVRVITY